MEALLSRCSSSSGLQAVLGAGVGQRLLAQLQASPHQQRHYAAAAPEGEEAGEQPSSSSSSSASASGSSVLRGESADAVLEGPQPSLYLRYNTRFQLDDVNPLKIGQLAALTRAGRMSFRKALARQRLDEAETRRAAGGGGSSSSMGQRRGSSSALADAMAARLAEMNALVRRVGQ